MRSIKIHNNFHNNKGVLTRCTLMFRLCKLPTKCCGKNYNYTCNMQYNYYYYYSNQVLLFYYFCNIPHLNYWNVSYFSFNISYFSIYLYIQTLAVLINYFYWLNLLCEYCDIISHNTRWKHFIRFLKFFWSK